jgi:hypothetical protein
MPPCPKAASRLAARWPDAMIHGITLCATEQSMAKIQSSEEQKKGETPDSENGSPIRKHGAMFLLW